MAVGKSNNSPINMYPLGFGRTGLVNSFNEKKVVFLTCCNWHCNEQFQAGDLDLSY